METLSSGSMTLLSSSRIKVATGGAAACPPRLLARVNRVRLPCHQLLVPVYSFLSPMVLSLAVSFLHTVNYEQFDHIQFCLLSQLLINTE